VSNTRGGRTYAASVADAGPLEAGCIYWRLIVSALNNILVPVDFEQTSEHALVYGRDLARRLGAGLHVLHVVDDVFALSAGTEGTLTEVPQLQKRIEENARELIARLITDDDRKAGIRAAIVTSSMTAHAIVSYARDYRIDLIVMGTHGKGEAPAAMMGSVAERVVRTAPCPVLTVRNPEHNVVSPEGLIARVAK
jgi:universal stress protein A